jgi:hypothetical protein
MYQRVHSEGSFFGGGQWEGRGGGTTADHWGRPRWAKNETARRVEQPRHAPGEALLLEGEDAEEDETLLSYSTGRRR